MGGVSSDINSARLSKATCILIDGCDTIRLTRLTGSLKNIVGTYLEHKDPGRYIPIVFLLYYWGSLLFSTEVYRWEIFKMEPMESYLEERRPRV